MATPTTNTAWTKPAVRQVKGAPVSRAHRSADVEAYVPELVKGMALTMRHFFMNTKELMLGQKPDPVLESLGEGITTICYPEERRPYPDRFRGVHRLTLRSDGSPRCVACLCCSTACPAQCISIDPAEYPVDHPRRGYERFPATFVIDELRCIFCGFCVEACPCDAIRMDTGLHAAPYDSRSQFIYDKEALLSFAGRDGKQGTENPRHEPGDPSHPGLTRDHEGH